MNLSITDKAILRKAKREGWSKKVSLRAIVESAQRKADAKVTRPGARDFTVVTDGEASDVRAEVIEKHRSEWAKHRERFPFEAIVNWVESHPELTQVTEGGEKLARVAKTMAETIRIRQQGEREAWGLDAIANDTSAGMATLDELDAMFEVAVRKADEARARIRAERGRPEAKTTSSTAKAPAQAVAETPDAAA
jgi:hypothetical protein